MAHQALVQLPQRVPCGGLRLGARRSADLPQAPQRPAQGLRVLVPLGVSSGDIGDRHLLLHVAQLVAGLVKSRRTVVRANQFLLHRGQGRLGLLAFRH